MPASCKRRAICSPRCSTPSTDADRVGRSPMTTLSTLGENNLLRSQFGSLQGDIQRLQTQLSTSEKAQVYGDLGSQASLDISLRNQATVVDDYKKNIGPLTIRTNLIDKSLVIINDSAL